MVKKLTVEDLERFVGGQYEEHIHVGEYGGHIYRCEIGRINVTEEWLESSEGSWNIKRLNQEEEWEYDQSRENIGFALMLESIEVEPKDDGRLILWFLGVHGGNRERNHYAILYPKAHSECVDPTLAKPYKSRYRSR